MTKFSIGFLSALLVAATSVPVTSHADFNRICRGANLPAYRKEIKAAVRAKLNAANISFRSIQVSYLNIVRSKDVANPDLETGLTLSGGSTPTVSLGGSFPALTTCDVTGKVRIRVVYPGGSVTVTKSAFSAPGSMLFKSRVSSSEGGLSTSPDAD